MNRDSLYTSFASMMNEQKYPISERVWMIQALYKYIGMNTM